MIPCALCVKSLSLGCLAAGIHLCHTQIMKVRGHVSRGGLFLSFLYILCFPLTARADELKLKDGTKITGTIVGYEGDSFKVETSYGFALVRKDKIASITFSEDKKADAAKKAAAREGASGPGPGSANASTGAGQGSAGATGGANAPPAAPASPPTPPPIREAVEGNYYVNHTYAFRMYKPPSWRLLEDARKLLPAAIVALGTEDESTLMILGRSPLRTSLDAHIAGTERELRAIYENFQLAEAERSVIAGVPALQRRFQGTADNRQWSGVFISMSRGPDVITILGMTSADSDLVQIQENVIARTVASLEFFK